MGIENADTAALAVSSKKDIQQTENKRAIGQPEENTGPPSNAGKIGGFTHEW